MGRESIWTLDDFSSKTANPTTLFQNPFTNRVEVEDTDEIDVLEDDIQLVPGDLVEQK